MKIITNKTEIIRSTQNSAAKLIRSLKQKSGRDKTGLFAAEGKNSVSLLPAGRSVEFFALSESFYMREDTSEYAKRGVLKVFSDLVYQSFSDSVTPQGISFVAKQERLCINELKTNGGSFFAVLENCTDPGNFGTIIRTACAAGFDGVIASEGCVDLYNPKTVRAAAGSIFGINVYTDINLADVFEIFRNNGVTIYAAAPLAEKSAYDCDYTKPSAFLIGNESAGLSKGVAKRANHRISLPVFGGAESLNAASACAVLIYEAVRQRLQKGV